MVVSGGLAVQHPRTTIMKRAVTNGLAALAAACILAPAAQAAPITGTIGFGDGLESVQNLPNMVVQGLTTINMFNQPGASLVAPCLGGFATLGCPTTGQATDFS